jgi:hypothetical protein
MFGLFSRRKITTPPETELVELFMQVKALVHPAHPDWGANDDFILREQYKFYGGTSNFGKTPIPVVSVHKTRYPEWLLLQAVRYLMHIYPREDGFYITQRHYKFAINLCNELGISPTMVDVCTRQVFADRKKVHDDEVLSERLSNATL